MPNNYNREDAIEYALKWGMDRNPKYYNFQNIGGDCTNFVSQCIYAGAKVMNYTQNTGWFYTSINNRAPAWTGVKFLYEFIINNKGPGPYGVATSIYDMQVGDFIQLGTDENSFHHSLFITRIDGYPSIDTIYVTTHTYDAINRPLSSYFINTIRFIHIEGVRNATL